MWQQVLILRFFWRQEVGNHVSIITGREFAFMKKDCVLYSIYHYFSPATRLCVCCFLLFISGKLCATAKNRFQIPKEQQKIHRLK